MLDLIRKPAQHLSRIQKIENEIAKLRVWAEKGIQPEPDIPAANVRNCHSLEQCMCTIVELEKELTAELDDWKNARLRAYSALLQVDPNPVYAEGLMRVLVEGDSERDVCRDIGIHRDTLRKRVAVFWEKCTKMVH